MYVDVINPIGSEGGRYSKRECLYNRTAYFVLVTVYFSSLFLCCAVYFGGIQTYNPAAQTIENKLNVVVQIKYLNVDPLLLFIPTTWTFSSVY